MTLDGFPDVHISGAHIPTYTKHMFFDLGFFFKSEK